MPLDGKSRIYKGVGFIIPEAVTVVIFKLTLRLTSKRLQIAYLSVLYLLLICF
jgi:hypothetical protein